jgi:hypothetical protein
MRGNIVFEDLHTERLLDALLTINGIRLCLLPFIRLGHHCNVADSPERSKCRRESLQEKGQILPPELFRHRWAVFDNVRKGIVWCILSHLVRNFRMVTEERKREEG